ncbi:EAL domain-containing protein [Rheinheimera sp. UJ51]|uniref:EAL domain-containing protein n=1 Tax=Rheinheimera sp. UJ51 TaxID=2892446 RepID=UPI001E562C1E|nr:EAL domain-containing protein [Rheinheimera sp. UJ51]MCC5451210.1 EAL domain-containing protein [Rheinheimera sp. UJ51]
MRIEKRLLILDDDELICKTIADVAKKDGFTVRYTTDYLTFQNLLDNWLPHNVIIDLNMPTMDGVQILNALADQGNQSKIVICSGVSERIIEAAARSAKARGLNIIGILPKPFYVKQIRDVLHEPLHNDNKHALKNVLQQQQAYDVNAIKNKLTHAIEHNIITFAVQPIIKCRTHQIKGFEVLARWQDDELGFISPDVFIKIAENHHLIDALTLLIFKQALTWFSELMQHCTLLSKEHKNKLTLSLNISACSLQQDHMVSELANLCADLTISPSNVILELTETAAMEDPILSMDLLTRLRLKGFRLSIDDFGTGFSSMLQLVRLPFSELKIDRSFTMTALEAEESKIVINATIELAHRLGLKVTAEGIEDEATLALLKRMNADNAQGYFIARPMAADKVTAWIEHNTQASEEKRIAILKAYELLDSPEEERFDRITRLAARLFNVPVSVFSLIDTNRQWFKSRKGTDLKETPRSVAFCDHTIREQHTFIVPDAQQDERFKRNSLVTGSPHIRFYAGYPVTVTEGESLGALCIIDNKPRAFSAKDSALLKSLAELVTIELQNSANSHADPITGLMDRKSFEKRAMLLNELCRKEGLTYLMLYFDLNGFNEINQQYGRLTGEEVLQEFANDLKSTFRESDLIARLGLDEFIVVMISNHDIDVEQLIQRLRDTIGFKKHNSANLPTIAFSYGSAISNAARPMTLQQLYHKADVMMHINSESKANRLLTPD